MDENTISYVAYESSQARMERVNNKQFIIILVLIAVCLGTNAGWLWRESQLEDVVITQEVDATADGENDLNIHTIGGDYNGGESTCETDG